MIIQFPANDEKKNKEKFIFEFTCRFIDFIYGNSPEIKDECIKELEESYINNDFEFIRHVYIEIIETLDQLLWEV